jgi:sulfatase maturation enzyme AslB (radical SAM superfamily)
MRSIERKVTAPACSSSNPKILTVIFKGLDKCNSGCSFCSVGNTTGKIMQEADFQVVTERLQELVKQWSMETLHFTFHGGEPTLLGAEFIEKICRTVCTGPVGEV